MNLRRERTFELDSIVRLGRYNLGSPTIICPSFLALASAATTSSPPFVAHYHLERNHQGLGNALIDGLPARPVGAIRRRPPPAVELLRARGVIVGSADERDTSPLRSIVPEREHQADVNQDKHRERAAEGPVNHVPETQQALRLREERDLLL